MIGARPKPPSVSPEAHNAVLRAALDRVDQLEPKLARIVQAILEEAGDEAARAFEAKATNHLTAAAANGDISSDATMVCLRPRPDEAAAIADPEGDAPATLHVTLAFLGGYAGELGDIAEALRPVAASLAPLAGVVGGYGIFDVGVGILLPDVRGLVELRVAVTEALLANRIDYGRQHGFEAHITVHSDPSTEQSSAALERAAGKPLHFDALHVCRSNAEEVVTPLTGVPALTADGGLTPDWTAPFPDELIDVEALVAEILARTDPVRRAIIEQTMTSALRRAGLAWDVTNPLTQQALAASASQVTHIAQTTRLNVMRVVKASYQNGLSIPQTSEAIRVGMSAASKSRATMIARTELGRAANAGSLAATRLVGGATGDHYDKVWLTAPGANYPRHEDYEGLDGQTVGLEETFDVGGESLQYPGDPNGDPGETINCRCAVSYQTPQGEETATADEPPDLGGAEEGDAGALGFTPALGAATALAPADVLDFQGGTRGALVGRRRKIEAASQQAGELVKLPDAANIPNGKLRVTMRSSRTSRGHMKYDHRGGRGVPIEINVASDAHPAVTLIHELGHLLDLSYLGDQPGLFAMTNLTLTRGELGDALKALDEAWRLSGSYRSLDALPAGDRLARYMKSRKELWARSFAQWVAEHSPVDAGVRREMDAMIEEEGRELAERLEVAQTGDEQLMQALGRFYPEAWQQDDFASISAAIERVLRAAGLLKD